MSWFVSYSESNRTITTEHPTEHAAEREAHRVQRAKKTTATYWEADVMEETA